MLLPDLKHMLNNQIHIPKEGLTFTKGVIKVNSFKILSGTADLVGIYKEGRSWRVVSSFGNYWTISSLNRQIQDQIYRMLLSHINPQYQWVQNMGFYIDGPE